MIQYGKQNIDQNDKEAVLEVLGSDYLTQGPKVEEFERELAGYCGVKYALAVNSGTAALHLAYLAVELQPGDEVITTPNSFVATTNMLLACGAAPIFCDIDLDTYNLDVSKVEELITPKTKAIVVVDFAGRPCDYDSLKSIADKHSLLLIADAAHSLGADHAGRKVGSLADITTLSFHPVKSITTAEGGALLTNSKEFYERAKLLRSHGVTKNEEGANEMHELGYNYRLPDLLAALGSSQLKRLDEFIAKRRQVAKWYREELGDSKNVQLPTDSQESAWHLYVIRTDNEKDRVGLKKHLMEAGIGTNFHYPAIYKHPYYVERGYSDVSCKNMEIYHKTGVTLPCYTQLTKDEIKMISDQIKNYFNE